MDYKSLYKTFTTYSLFTYIISCTLPVHGDGYMFQGFLMALFGWASIFVGEVTTFMIWLANPLFLFCLTMMKNRTNKYAALAIAFVSFLFGGIYMFVTGICGPITFESGSLVETNPIHIGYYIWLLALLLMLIATTLRYIAYKDSEEIEDNDHEYGCV